MPGQFICPEQMVKLGPPQASGLWGTAPWPSSPRRWPKEILKNASIFEKGIQAAACTHLRSHTCGLSRVFFKAHVLEKDSLYFLPPPAGGGTLRGRDSKKHEVSFYGKTGARSGVLRSFLWPQGPMPTSARPQGTGHFSVGATLAVARRGGAGTGGTGEGNSRAGGRKGRPYDVPPPPQGPMPTSARPQAPMPPQGRPRQFDEIFPTNGGGPPPVLGAPAPFFPRKHQISWREKVFQITGPTGRFFPESLDFSAGCVYDYNCNHL